MNNLKSIPPQTTTFPLLALLLASGAGVVLAALRVIWTGDVEYFFLVWNIFLAWLPLLFSLAVCHLYKKGVRRGWRIYSLAALWLLFFPNAPYIFTDLIHLTNYFYAHFWVDLSLVLLFALTGFLLGFVSLYLMQQVVADRFGRFAGWLFIVVVTALSGVGIYWGRFLRLNSWDIVANPFKIIRGIGEFVAHPLANHMSLVFPTLFATFLFLGYLMLYALTHLQPAHQPAAAAT
jgi:uncharacterized membrane protein